MKIDKRLWKFKIFKLNTVRRKTFSCASSVWQHWTCLQNTHNLVNNKIQSQQILCFSNFLKLSLSQNILRKVGGEKIYGLQFQWGKECSLKIYFETLWKIFLEIIKCEEKLFNPSRLLSFQNKIIFLINLCLKTSIKERKRIKS